jgi:hypothetical protein
LKLGYNGGNLAGCVIDYYADFDTDIQRLTLHVRQKLHRGKYTRYQFEFELQEDPIPPPQATTVGVAEIRCVFVPVKKPD